MEFTADSFNWRNTTAQDLLVYAYDLRDPYLSDKRHLLPGGAKWVNDDWVDVDVMGRIMEDLEKDGRRFYSIDSGQSAVLLYLNTPMAARLNKHIGDTAKPVLGPPKPQNPARDQKTAKWWEFWRH